MSAPTIPTVKRLFAESGNVCAFEKCEQELVAGETVVGDICHICAAKPGGPRFDQNQTEQDRASYDNLILMCPTHHRVIDSDAGSYPVETLRQLKEAQTNRQNSTCQVTDAMAQTALIMSGVAVSAAADAVVSINQSGGITAHTVNQAPAPEFRISSQSSTHEGEWFKMTVVAEVVAPYPVAGLYLEARSKGIEEFHVLPMRSGMAMYGHTGKRDGFCFTTLQQAHGKYTLTVRSKDKQVQIAYRFD